MSAWDNFRNWLSDAAQNVGDRITPDADTTAGGWLGAANDAYTNTNNRINQTMSAGWLATNPFQQNTFLNPSAAWTQAENVSAGQAFGTNPLSLVAPTSILNPSSPAMQNLFAWSMRKPEFQVDVTDERVRKAVFEENTTNKLITGAVDFGIDWYTDPLVIGGKAIKVGRAAVSTRPLRTITDQRAAVQEIIDHQAWVDTRGVQGKRTGMGQLIEDLTRGTATENAMHPALRKSNSLAALSHLTGEAKDFNETALIVRAALKDENAISYLREYRASTADALDLWSGLAAPDAIQMQNAAGAMFFTGTNATLGRYVGQRAQHFLASTADDAEKYSRVMDDLKARDRYLAKFEDDLLAQGTDFGSNVSAAKWAPLEARRGSNARSRAESFFGDVNATTNETVFQRNPMMRAVRYFTWHPLRERQSGWVNFAGANMVDAHKEIMAALDQVPVYTRWSKSADPALRERAAQTKTALMEKWFAAGDDYSRMQVVNSLERQVLSDMGDFYGISRQTMDEMLNAYSESRSSAIKQFKTQGFAVDPVDGSLIKSPQLLSQLPERTPIMDFHAMDRLVRRNITTLSLPRKAQTVGETALEPVAALIDSFYAVWRPATLLRLGYTQRNVFEGNLRAMVAYGFIPSLVDPWGTLGRFGRNRANDARWAANRIWAMGSREVRDVKNESELAKDALVTARETAAQHRLSMEQQLGQWVDPSDHLHDYMLGKINRNQFVIQERKAARDAAASGQPVMDKRTKYAITLENRYQAGQISLSDLKRLLTKNAQWHLPGQLRQLRGTLSAADKATGAAESYMVYLNRQLADLVPGRGHTLRYGTAEGEAFDGGAGLAAIANSSASRTTQSMIADPASEAFNRHVNEVSRWGKITPLDDSGVEPVINKDYFKQLVSVTERQVKNDPVARMILEGRDDADIVTWIRSTGDQQAREWRNGMKKAGVDVADPDQHVADLRGILHYYYPSPEIRRGVLDNHFTADQLKDLYAGIETERLPVIHGRITKGKVLEAGIPQLGAMWRGGTQKLYQILGTAPEDILVRHPFYAKVWENEVKRLAQMDEQVLHATAGPLTAAEVSARRAAIERSAHRTALKATRETLYTIERESNLTAALRWVSPFFAAQENTLRVWAGFAVRDPSLIAHAQMIYDAPNRAHMVVDADGNEIPPASLPGADIWRDQYMSLDANDSVSQWLFGGGRAKVSKQSINVILQGQNFLTPGFGPPVGMAANMYFRDHPDQLAALKGTAIGNMAANAILPFGAVQTDETWKMILPAWIDRVVTVLQKDGSKEYQNFYMMQAVALQVDIENGYVDAADVPKTKEEFDAMVEDRTRHAYFMRAAANLTLPFAISMDSKYEFYVNEYRNLLRSSPDESSAFATFTDKYPDFWAVTASLSKNASRMSPTISAYKRFKANESLARNVAHDYPDLVGMITNPIGITSDPFDQGVYAWQYDRQIMDNNPEIKFRSIQSVQSAMEDARAKLGWKEFNRSKAIIDTALADNGYKSIQSAPQEIQDLWKETIDNLKNQYPEWASQKYQITAPSEVSRKIETIASIVNDQSFQSLNGDEPMWRVVRGYLADRQVIATALAKMTDPKDKKVIRELWAETVQQYTDSNTQFATFYNRWLDYDPEVSG